MNPPTLDVASVKLFNVVLLPLEGLPTSPIKGSRGIVELLKSIYVAQRRGRKSEGGGEIWSTLSGDLEAISFLLVLKNTQFRGLRISEYM